MMFLLNEDKVTLMHRSGDLRQSGDVSWYKLGDKTLFMMNDSKSWQSLTYRGGTSWERSDKNSMAILIKHISG